MRDIKGKWSGTVDQFSHDHEETIPATLTIDEMIGDEAARVEFMRIEFMRIEFMGTMEWPSSDTVTQVQGYLDGERMIWSETEFLKGEDVVLYGLYVARFTSAREIEGDWMDPRHTISPRGPDYGVAGARFKLARE